MTLPLIDAMGNEHRPTSAEAARIVSLVPSLTELLFDLGLGDKVVGRTAFCVHPADRVKSVRSVGGTKSIHMDRLLGLRPTHVLVNVDETPRAMAEELAATGCTVVVTHPIKVRDNLALYSLVGGLFGKREEAESLCRRFEGAYDAALSVAERLPERRVLYLIWRDPWMTVARDTYIARMLALVGLHTLPATSDRRYPSVELTQDLLEQLDLVLFSTEPFPFKDRHLAGFRASHPAHAGKAAIIDGQMVSWYGSRAVQGLGYLAAFAAGHR
jgi:ABC-type Fe3+-hydroxamate transport system substrate-binding protein